MARSSRTLALLVCVALVGGCATVTVNTGDSIRRGDPPTWSDRKWFFLSGLIGDRHVDVKQVCGGKQVLQMQSQQTFTDGLIGVLTLGIWSPRTAKVWCQ